ncbi:MBL fold metallo-hydrolase [Anaerotignum sp.]|uniref:MBL fold metallo-hydrolase n=1 Tax=Anaerotignum sp. TaxID=2039241 RepID=UPI0027147760|nr:MBL fold metallo-hydrolase [Anaerotignum sp.]
MKFMKISEHIYFMEHNPETDRPALGYVRGEKGGFMMDAGNSAAHYHHFIEKLQENKLPHPRYLSLTHAHWDHSFGLWATKTATIAGGKTNKELEKMSHWAWDEESMKNRLKTGEDSVFSDTHIRREYSHRSDIKVKTAEISFNGSMTIDLGDVTCILREIVSPHCRDSVVFIIPQDGVIFLGDSYCSAIQGEEWFYDKVLLTAYIDEIEKIDFRLAIKGHHPPQTKEELLAELKSEWKKL